MEKIVQFFSFLIRSAGVAWRGLTADKRRCMFVCVSSHPFTSCCEETPNMTGVLSGMTRFRSPLRRRGRFLYAQAWPLPRRSRSRQPRTTAEAAHLCARGL
jgi:hypothetical protein